MVKILFRISVLLLGIFSAVGGISLIINNVIIIQNITEESVISNLISTNIIIGVMSFIGTITSLFTLIITEHRGMKSYEKLLKNIDISGKSISSLSNIKIPNTDEMGNLGSVIKNFIDNMISYDNMKKGLIKKQKAMKEYIGETITDPLVIIDHYYSIKEVNESFEKIFHVEETLEKEIFDIITFHEYNLKAMSDSYEKHSSECCFTINEQMFKSILNVKRFKNEKGFQEYLLIFSQTEESEDQKEDDYYNTYLE